GAGAAYMYPYNERQSRSQIPNPNPDPDPTSEASLPLKVRSGGCGGATQVPAPPTQVPVIGRCRRLPAKPLSNAAVFIHNTIHARASQPPSAEQCHRPK
ncbi:hypothetical protein L249_3265, partial [Ophiocordyceps polyrhachis-furcata BCC 54312]